MHRQPLNFRRHVSIDKKRETRNFLEILQPLAYAFIACVLHTRIQSYYTILDCNHTRVSRSSPVLLCHLYLYTFLLSVLVS